MRYHSERSIRSELNWMSALRIEAGIETPEAVPTRDGSLVQALPGSDRLAVLFTFVEGTPPPETDLLPEFQRLGEIAARMHRHAKSWDPPAWFLRHAWTPETILGEAALWGSWRAGVDMTAERVAIIDRAAKTIERRIATLSRDRESFGLIHADMRLANLLVADGRTRVIDFDDCGFGWYGYDLATALSFIQERSDVPELIEAWLAGYRRIMPLSAEFQSALPSLIMLRRINEIAWLGATQHVAFAKELAPRFAIDSCRLAEDYLRTHG
jgi:Ser/Thr protein kinase RdoA (MazF antagonist)